MQHIIEELKNITLYKGNPIPATPWWQICSFWVLSWPQQNLFYLIVLSGQEFCLWILLLEVDSGTVSGGKRSRIITTTAWDCSDLRLLHSLPLNHRLLLSFLTKNYNYYNSIFYQCVEVHIAPLVWDCWSWRKPDNGKKHNLKQKWKNWHLLAYPGL